jgi:HK97 family phage prohead protease
MTTMQHKTLTATTAKTAKGFSAIVTTETIDRDGEVLVPGGMNSKNYEANPVLLWMHDPAKPIGKCVGIKRGTYDVAMSFEFAQKPDGWKGDWEPDYIAGLVGAGVLNAVSVGFRPIEGGYRRATKGDVDKYGQDVRGVFSKWELLEVSLVSIPANQEALITAVTKGLLSPNAATFAGAKITVTIPHPTKHTIAVSVPKMGTENVSRIVAREIARKSGRIWY